MTSALGAEFTNGWSARDFLIGVDDGRASRHSVRVNGDDDASPIGHHGSVTTDSKYDQLPRWMALAPFAVAGFGLIAGVSWDRVAGDFVVTGVIVGTVALLLARRSSRAADVSRSPGFGPMADSPNELQRWAATSALGYFVMWLVLGLFLAVVSVGLLALRGAEISYPKTVVIAVVGALGAAVAGFVITTMGSRYATRGSKQVKYLRPFLPWRRED